VDQHQAICSVSGAPFSWKSSKQTCVALSTAEAEYMSPTLAAQEAIWLNRLLAELQSQQELFKPAIIIIIKNFSFMDGANILPSNTTLSEEMN